MRSTSKCAASGVIFIAQSIRKVLGQLHVSQPRVIRVDGNGAYPSAIADLKEENLLNKGVQYRSSKYLNNLIEQAQRFIKRRVKSGLGFFSYQSAARTLQSYEVMNMIRKRQVEGAEKQQIAEQNLFISKLFGLDA